MKLYLKLVIFGAVMLSPLFGEKPEPMPGQPASPSILDDPEWQKRFLGSYGFRSAFEPKITPQEAEMLRDYIDLMKAEPLDAAEQIEPSIKDESSAAILFILANLYFQAGDMENAKENYEKAIEKHPDYLRAHKNLGLLLMQEQKFSESVKHLSRATELGEMDGRTQGLMAYAYLNLQNLLAAEECYRDAIQMEPEVLDWKLGLGRVLNETGRNQESIALFESLIEENPTDPKLWLLQANAYLGAQQPEKAAVDLEMARALGGADKDSLRLLGDIYLNLGVPDEALAAYQQAMGASEADGQQLALRSAKLLYQTGSPEKAKELLDAAQARFGSSMTNDEKLSLLTLQASIAKSTGNTTEAINTLEDIVKQDGTQGDAIIELASIYYDEGSDENKQRAFMLLDRAVKLQDYQYQALLKQAQYLARERKYAEASKLLEAALQIKDEPRTREFLMRIRQAMRS